MSNINLNKHNLNKHNLIGVGVFARVHRLDGGTVRKVPAPDPDNLSLAMKSIRREGAFLNVLLDRISASPYSETSDHRRDIDNNP